ncbi:DUF5908 family protein [Pedobacter sp. B4-66]|uniref:DUF5908 family protein n=1 Tax=Pedobacter sp. B4-66 TaxID=2817280 RepID=UPI001BD96B06|nr:DUF5908 family protein [Pedobacter sp. B4-66]
MPIEIRELIIKATIVQDGNPASRNSNSVQNNGVSPSEEVIKVCIEKVLEILKERDER